MRLLSETREQQLSKYHLPGMRAFKTAIAVFGCVSISALTPLISPFFMSLAAIITMQVSTSDSVKMGRTRILGTAVGALIGMSFAMIQPESALFSALGILLIIHICNRLHWNGATQIAAFVFMAIMVNLGGQDPLGYSLSRLVDTAIGVVIGLLVNYFVFPYNNLPIIKSKFAELEGLLKAVLKPVLEAGESGCQPPGEPVEISELRASLLSIRDEIQLYRQEAKIQKGQQGAIDPYERDFQTCWDIFEHLKHLNMLIIAMAEPQDQSASTLDELLIVYHYHLRQIRLDLASRDMTLA